MSSSRQHGQLQVFALQRSRVFGEQVARRLSIALSLHEEREFEDREHKIRSLVSVRGNDVYVIHSLYADAAHSSDDKLCRLLFFIGALKDAAAARVTAVVPYLAYARKDRKTQPRDPVMTRYIATLFEAIGTDALITLDVHDLAAFQNAFRCPTEALTSTSLFVRHFTPLLKEHDVAVVAPDAGGIGRAAQLRQRLAVALGKPVGTAFAEKYRHGGQISGDHLVGDVNGKSVLIIDDMISTGSTLARTARACHRNGAREILAAATHGLFTHGAGTMLADPVLNAIVVTDTIATGRLDSAAVLAKITTLDAASLFAEAIQRMHAGGSIVALLGPDP